MGKKKLLFITAVWTALLVFVFPDAAAIGQSSQEISPTALPPGIGMHVKATPEIATVGDPIRIDLDVTAPSGYRLKVLRPETQIGEFAILAFSAGPAAPPSQPHVGEHYQAHILAALYNTGKFTFPPVRMELTAADGKEIALSSSPVTIEIQSVLTGKEQNLKGPKKQAEIPERRGWMIWLGVAAALSIAAIRWILRRRKRQRLVPLSPKQTLDLMDLAETDLRSLLARGLPDNGGEKQFYVLLSEIAKRILEAGYSIPAAERTTSEIINSLHGKPDVESRTADLIESFLFHCDAVKFAKYAPSTVEHKAAANDLMQILAEARKAVGSGQ